MNYKQFQKQRYQPRIQQLESRRLLAGDAGILSQEPSDITPTQALVSDTGEAASVVRGQFDVEDFRWAVKTGVGGNRISAMLHGVAIIHHGNTLQTFVPASDPSRPWINQSSVTFDATKVSFEVVGTLRIETLASDRLLEQTVSGLPEVSFGRGMSGSGGTYVTQNAAILTLSADIQSILDDPTIELDMVGRSQVEFEAFAQLLLPDEAGQYYVADTISLGNQKAGMYSEFLSSGLLTLRNPNGRVTTVSIDGQSLSVNQINSPQGSQVGLEIRATHFPSEASNRLFSLCLAL